MTPPTPLRDPVNDVRIRAGQRSLILCTARRIGLRDEQLHDLVENASDFATRAIARLTIGQARRLIGTLKVMERATTRLSPPGQAPTSSSDDLVKRAARRAGGG